MRLLWAGPQTEARMVSYFSEFEPSQVRAALEALIAEGRVLAEKGRKVVHYRLSTDLYRQGEDSWMARIDGLNHFLRSVANLIRARFLGAEGEAGSAAVVRTISFRIRREDFSKLTDLYQQTIFPLVCQLDAEAESRPADETALVNLALHWAEERDM
jgi:hypothetical protein